MNKRLVAFLVLLVSAALLLVACSGASQPTSDDDESDVGVEEHVEGDANAEDEHDEDEGDDHAHIDPPAEYATLTNPFVGDLESIEAGEVIYATNCASCHGTEGTGDGPAAEALDPKPTNLADAHMMEELSDGYLYWRVSEGGSFEPFNSGMLAWKEILSEEERWQVISFIRNLDEEH